MLWGEEIDIEARGLYLTAGNPVGDATDGMPGLCIPEKGPGNGKPFCAWLLDADEAGMGGEKGIDDG